MNNILHHSKHIFNVNIKKFENIMLSNFFISNFITSFPYIFGMF